MTYRKLSAHAHSPGSPSSLCCCTPSTLPLVSSSPTPWCTAPIWALRRPDGVKPGSIGFSQYRYQQSEVSFGWQICLTAELLCAMSMKGRWRDGPHLCQGVPPPPPHSSQQKLVTQHLAISDWTVFYILSLIPSELGFFDIFRPCDTRGVFLVPCFYVEIFFMR